MIGYRIAREHGETRKGGVVSIIELRGVTTDYMLGKTVVEAVKGVDIAIEAGDFISIAGPSGSGKSTILNMIGLIDTPTAGEVLIDGKTTANLPDNTLTDLRHDFIGFIFQSFNLIPVLTVRENIEFPLLLGKKPRITKENRDWIDYLIGEVALQDHQLHRPNELSGGQRQRVAIARALVAKPRVVLADEPTANLDSVTGSQILALMKKVNRDLGTTFVFSTHDGKVVEIADHVIALKDGLVVTNERAKGDPSGRAS